MGSGSGAFACRGYALGCFLLVLSLTGGLDAGKDDRGRTAIDTRAIFCESGPGNWPSAGQGGKYVTETTLTPGPDVARQRSARRSLIIGANPVAFPLIIAYVITGAPGGNDLLSRGGTAR